MATYYVDNSHNSASDENAGTVTSPWRTLQHAADRVTAGDTVYVKAGTYKPFEIDVSGSAGARIVFAAAPGHEHKAVIDGSGTSVRGVIEARGESHLTVSGFRIQNAPVDGIYVEGSPAGSHDIRIVGNQIASTDNAGIYAAGRNMGQTIDINEYRLFNLTIANNEVTKTNLFDGGSEAISVGGGVNGFVIRNNWVHHSEQYGIDTKLGAINGRIYDNLIHDIEKHGVYLDTNSRTIENIKIYNNVIFNNNNGIVLARESTRDPRDPNIRDIEIYNNKVFGNDKFGIMAYRHEDDVLTGDFDDVWIHHNSVANNGRNGIQLVDIAKVAENFVVSDNVLYRNAGIDINNQIAVKLSGNTFNVIPNLSVPNSADVLGGAPIGGSDPDNGSVTPPDSDPQPQDADRFVFGLINAASDTVIDADLSNGVTGLDAQEQQGPLTLAAFAVIPGSISGSVELTLSGPGGTVTHAESNAPYAIFGDGDGDFWGEVLPEGQYTITATNAGQVESVDFTLELF